MNLIVHSVSKDTILPKPLGHSGFTPQSVPEDGVIITGGSVLNHQIFLRLTDLEEILQLAKNSDAFSSFTYVCDPWESDTLGG